MIAFTMPEDLGDIGDWAGLLGHPDGGHPYPYFNANGLYFEQQNGPHPQEAVLSLDYFDAGESYTVQIVHTNKEDEGDCFTMWIDDEPSPYGHVEWCYDYEYNETPIYVGCG